MPISWRKRSAPIIAANSGRRTLIDGELRDATPERVEIAQRSREVLGRAGHRFFSFFFFHRVRFGGDSRRIRGFRSSSDRSFRISLMRSRSAQRREFSDSVKKGTKLRIEMREATDQSRAVPASPSFRSGASLFLTSH